MKHAKAALHGARKLLRYRRDILKPEVLDELTRGTDALAASVKARRKDDIIRDTDALEKAFERHMPTPKDAGWRENTEVFLVAIVIAIGFRSYILQPFTIPTGSMQPTLNGILAYQTETPPPNFLVQFFDAVWSGRTWYNAVSKVDDRIVKLQQVKRIPLGGGRGFFTATKIICENQTFTVAAQPSSVAQQAFPGRPLRAGEVIVRGYEETGDHVLVNKVSYHFRRPERGEVFVFSTKGIRFIERSLRDQGITSSQYYIKRLAGLPGDELRIVQENLETPGKLYVNGSVAQEFGLLRVMSGENGYRGYVMTQNLGSPNAKFRVPPKQYYALGDNSYNSQDSRYFGTAPEENLMGSACFVYWPFGRHWGLIR